MRRSSSRPPFALTFGSVRDRIAYHSLTFRENCSVPSANRSKGRHTHISSDFFNGYAQLLLKTRGGYRSEENRKGRDIGYALATSSCEEANSVDACTVTALDVITAFAVPNPNCPSQDRSVFSGLVALRVTPVSRSPSLLRTGKILFKPTLSAVDVCQLK